MTLVAHSIKAGDTINGLEVFDSYRRGFGGFYIPMIDGTRFQITSPDQMIKID